MGSSKKSNLDLSQNEFDCLQNGAQNATYRQLTIQVVHEIQFTLQPTIRLLTHHSEDAQDLLASVIEKFWQNLPHLEYGYLNSWLINVCRNLHISDWRKTPKIELTNDWLEADLGCEPPAEMEPAFWDNHTEQVSILNHLLQDVAEERRAIFIEHHLNHESIVDLAQKLDIRPNTLVKRHTRIMEDLRCKANRFKSFF
jgi:RNA polymerase sigma factor (sigma-70 family)